MPAYGKNLSPAEVNALVRHVAPYYSDEQIALFDDVFHCLMRHIEASAKALLANRLAPIGTASNQPSACAVPADAAMTPDTAESCSRVANSASARL